MNLLVAEARRMALSKGQRPASKGSCVVYFLRLRSGSLYIGASEDLEKRLEDHAAGRACRTTALDPAECLLRIECFDEFPQARAREAQLKRWLRAKKDALIAGDLKALKTLARSRDHAGDT